MIVICILTRKIVLLGNWIEIDRELYSERLYLIKIIQIIYRIGSNECPLMGSFITNTVQGNSS